MKRDEILEKYPSEFYKRPKGVNKGSVCVRKKKDDDDDDDDDKCKNVRTVYISGQPPR